MNTTNKILDTYSTLTNNDKKLIRGMNLNLKMTPDLDKDVESDDDLILFI